MPDPINDPTLASELDSLASAPSPVEDPNLASELDSLASPKPTVNPVSAARDELKSRLKEFRMLPAFTSSATSAWDKELVKENGVWKTPMLGITPDKDAGMLESLGLGMSAAVQGGLSKFFGAQTGSLDSEIKRLQKVHGLDDAQMQSAWSDLVNEYRTWEPDEKTRVLSDGTISLNPASRELLDTPAIEKIIDESGAPDQAKADAKRNLPNLQSNAAQAKLEGYEAAATALKSPGGRLALLPFGVGGQAIQSTIEAPSEYAKRTGRKDMGTAAFMRDYERDVAQGNPVMDFARGIATDWILGANNVAVQTLGNAAMLGSEKAGAVAAAGQEAANAITAGKPDTGITGQVVQQVLPIGAMMVATQLTGAAAALTGSEKVLGVVNSLSPIIYSGAQSAGAQYAQSRAEGKDHEAAQSDAAKAGATTALITGMFSAAGMGGVEDVAAGKQLAGVTIGDLLKSKGREEVVKNAKSFAGKLAKGFGEEYPEEWSDQLVSAFVNADPDTNLSDAWQQAWDAGMVGGIMGTGTAAFTGNPEAAKTAIEIAPDLPDTAKALVEVTTPAAPEDQSGPEWITSRGLERGAASTAQKLREKQSGESIVGMNPDGTPKIEKNIGATLTPQEKKTLDAIDAHTAEDGTVDTEGLAKALGYKLKTPTQVSTQPTEKIPDVYSVANRPISEINSLPVGERDAANKARLDAGKEIFASLKKGDKVVDDEGNTRTVTWISQDLDSIMFEDSKEPIEKAHLMFTSSQGRRNDSPVHIDAWRPVSLSTNAPETPTEKVVPEGVPEAGNVPTPSGSGVATPEPVAPVEAAPESVTPTIPVTQVETRREGGEPAVSPSATPTPEPAGTVPAKIKLSGFRAQGTQRVNRDLILESLGDANVDTVETDSGVKVEMHPFEDGVELRAIQNLGGTSGAASEILTKITEEADSLGAKLYLHPKPFGSGKRLSKDELIAWYGRHGFTLSENGETMVRDPKNLAAETPQPQTPTPQTDGQNERQRQGQGRQELLTPATEAPPVSAGGAVVSTNQPQTPTTNENQVQETGGTPPVESVPTQPAAAGETETGTALGSGQGQETVTPTSAETVTPTPREKLLTELGTPKNPGFPDKVITPEGVAVELTQDGDKIKVSVETPQEIRNTGKATAAMTRLTDLARRDGVTLDLDVVPMKDQPMSKEALTAWYAKLGFTDNGDGTMTFSPETTKPAAEKKPAEPPMPHSVETLKTTFGVSDDVAVVTDVLAKAMGIDLAEVVYRRGGEPGSEALKQGGKNVSISVGGQSPRNVLLSKNTIPGEKPYRATWFQDNGQPAGHTDLSEEEYIRASNGETVNLRDGSFSAVLSSPTPEVDPDKFPVLYYVYLTTQKRSFYNKEDAVRSAKRNGRDKVEVVYASGRTELKNTDELDAPEKVAINWDATGIGGTSNQEDISYFGYVRPMSYKTFRSIAAPGNWNVDTVDFAEAKMRQGEAVSPPFLEVQWDEDKKVLVAYGHEGRSRSDAANRVAPGEDIPVHIFVRGKRARSLTDEIKNAPIVPEKGGAPVVVEPITTLYQRSPDTARFEELTSSIPANPTQADLDAWKATHPDEYQELKAMRERVLLSRMESVSKFASEYLSARDRGMESSVILGADYLKILDPIIESIPVDVVNMFGSKERASDMLLHNPSVFEDILTSGETDLLVRENLQRWLGRDAQSIAASLGAALSSIDVRRFDPERVFTIHALYDNLVSMGGRFSSIGGYTGTVINQLPVLGRLETSFGTQDDLPSGNVGGLPVELRPADRALAIIGFHSANRVEYDRVMQANNSEPLSTDATGALIPPDQWGDTGNPSILYQRGSEPPSVERGHLMLREDFDAEIGKVKPLPREVFYVGDVEVIRNPSNSDRQRMSSEVRAEFGRDISGDPTTRFTNDERGNTWIWKAHQGMHSQVEPGIKRKEGVDVNQNARKPEHSDVVKQAIRDKRFIPDAVKAQYPQYAEFMDYTPVEESPSTLYQFAGENANVPQFMRDSLDTAKAMAAAGKPSEEIRAVTGWFPGKYDGKMRWEIPDNGATSRRNELMSKLDAEEDSKWVVGEKLKETQAAEMADAVERTRGVPKDQLLAESRRIMEKHNAEKVALRDFYAGEENPNRTNNRVPLWYILDHPALFDAYPDIRNLPVSFSLKDLGDAGSLGAFNPSMGVIALNPLALDSDEKVTSTLLHEIQHWIQQKEGTAKGASPEKFAGNNLQLMVNKQRYIDSLKPTLALLERIGPVTDAKIAEMTEEEKTAVSAAWNDRTETWKTADDIRNQIEQTQKELDNIDFDGTESYNRTAGEIEARDIQARANMTPEQLAATAPYSSENIAPEAAIVLNQRGKGIKGSVEFLADGKALIRGFKSADASTGIHELTHVARRQLFDRSVPESQREGITDDDITTVEDFCGAKNGVWDEAAEEKFARANERYLYEGKAPSQLLAPIFAKMSAWLQKIYAQVKGSPIDIEISPAMRAVLDKLYQRGDINQAIADTPPEPLVPEIPPVEFVEPEPTPPGRASHEMSDQERANLGLPPRIPQPTVTDSDVWATAQATEDAHRAAGKPGTAGTDLMHSKLANMEFTLDSKEQALIIHEIVTRRNTLSAAQRTLTSLPKNAPDLTKSEAQKAVTAAQESYQEVLDFNDAIGSEEGRAFRLRRWIMALDYTYEGLSRRLHAAKNAHTTGNALTPQEIATAAEYAQKLEQAQARLDALTSENAEQARLIEELTADVERAQKRDSATKSKVRKAVTDRAAEAKKRLQERGVTFLAQAQDIDAQTLKDFAAVAAEWLVDKPLTIAEFTQKLTTTFGTWISDHAERIFKTAKQTYNETAASVTGKSAPSPEQVIAEIEQSDAEEPTRKEVWQLARAYVIAGVRGENVLDETHAALSELFNGLSRDRVAEIFTDYGKTSYPSQDDASKELGRIKNLERIALKITDLKAGRIPKQTGFQRDPDAVNLEVRQLEREFRRLYKEEVEAGRIPDSGADGRAKSALASAKTRMRNEIEEIDDALRRNRAMASKKSSLTLDEEATQLRADLEAKRNAYNEAFPKEGLTDEKRREILIRNLDRQIAQETQMLADGILKKVKTAPVADTPDIAERRRKLAALRKERRDLYDAANPLREAKANTRRAIERLTAIIEKGRIDIKEKKPVNPDDELRALIETREALADEVDELRRASEEYQTRQIANALRAAEASLDRVSRKLASGDLSVPAKTVTPASRDAAVQAIRARVKELNADLDARRREEKVGPYSDEARLTRELASLAKRKAELERRIREKDVSRKAKNLPLEDARKRRAQYEIELLKAEFSQMEERLIMKNAPLTKKAQYYGIGAANLLKIVTLGFDVGVVLRQLGTTYQALVADLSVFSKNGDARKNGSHLARLIKTGVRAFADPAVESEIYEQVKNRPGAEYDNVGSKKIYFSPPFDTFSSTKEDIPRADLMKDIPWFVWPAIAGVKWFVFGMSPPAGVALVAVGALTKPLLTRLDRAQRAMTNVSRADFVDSARRAASAEGAIALKPADYSVMNNAVMVATGRGQIKKLDPAIPVANVVLLATRFYLSRIMALSLQPLFAEGIFTPKESRAGMRARTEIAKMYARSIAGRASLYALLWAMLGRSDDEKEKKGTGLILNPFSNDFGRYRVNENLKVDFMSGINSFASITARYLGRRRYDATTGKYTALGGGFRNNVNEEATRFLSSKMNLLTKFIVDTHAGQYFGGKPVTVSTAFEQASTAIITNDVVRVYEEMIGTYGKEEGTLKATAICLLMFSGMGASVRPSADEQRALKAMQKEIAKDERRRERELNE